MYKLTSSMICIFLVSFFSFNGCFDDDSPNENSNIKGSGRIISETRNVGECQGIFIASAGNVIVSEGSSQSIRVEADDNIIDEVITEKVNGMLKVGLKNKSYSNINVKVYVSLFKVQRLEIQGAGNIKSEEELGVDSLYLLINGAGNIEVKGSGNFLNCLINGAGNIESQQFVTKECIAVTKGVGNCTVNVTEKLNARVEGVGSIIYYGNPPDVSTSITGVGNIVKK